MKVITLDGKGKKIVDSNENSPQLSLRKEKFNINVVEIKHS